VSTAARVGLFGGAFDPPHRAHEALAAAAIDQLRLDRLHICPTGHAWHKARDLLAAEHRVAMTRLAFEDLPRVHVDDREVRRAGPTYTIDTLRELAREYPGAQLFLLMGQDQADSFTAWREWEAIASLAELVVARRGTAGETRTHGLRFTTLDLPIHAESSTDVRKRLTTGQGIAELVHPRVASYIAQHHLYTRPE